MNCFRVPSPALGRLEGKLCVSFTAVAPEPGGVPGISDMGGRRGGSEGRKEDEREKENPQTYAVTVKKKSPSRQNHCKLEKEGKIKDSKGFL